MMKSIETILLVLSLLIQRVQPKQQKQLLQQLQEKGSRERPFCGNVVDYVQRHLVTYNEDSISCSNENEALFEFNITLDAFPTDTSYFLKCFDSDNVTKTFLQSKEFEASDEFHSFYEEVCIPTTALQCYFTVFDSAKWQDGLTADEGAGYFNATLNGNVIASYDGTKGQKYQLYSVEIKPSDEYMSFKDNVTITIIYEYNESGASDPGSYAASPKKVKNGVNKNNDYDSKECEDAMFTIMFDAYPDEVGYVLVCENECGENETIWDAPEGSYFQQDAFHVIQKNACINNKQTCYFTVSDGFGDGLTIGNRGGRVGYFALLYGPETVAVYDASQGYAYYSQVNYCFGPRCACPPTGVDADEWGDIDDNNSTCDHFVEFDLTVDEFPWEISFQLKCGTDELIWDVNTGHLNEPFGSYRNTECLDTYFKSNYCCKFTIHDDFNDGLTSPERDLPGVFELRVSNSIVVSYDGSDHDAAFTELTLVLPGSKCGDS